MALLKLSDTPPGGWAYFQRETEFTLKGDNRDMLIDNVVAHRTYKNLHPQQRDLVRVDIERQICTRLGRLYCRAEDESDKWVPQDDMREVVTMGDVLSFSKAALAWVKSGGSLVTKEESERRAAICRVCPLNEPMTGCSCGTLYKILDATVPQDRSIADMHVCKACHCTLRVKVLLTPEQVFASNEGRDVRFPAEVECWQRSIMESFDSKPSAS